MACFVDLAPCSPRRILRISSCTNSPACVLGDLPARLSRRAFSMVCLSGIVILPISMTRDQPANGSPRMRSQAIHVARLPTQQAAGLIPPGSTPTAIAATFSDSPFAATLLIHSPLGDLLLG